MATAEDYGRRLLGEVEVVGLDEMLQSLRLQQNGDTNANYFNFRPLDRLIRIAVEAKPQTAKSNPTSPIVELLSTAPGGGKTHLLYYLCTRAILPTSHGGKQSCVVVIDADGYFSVDRLASQVQLEIHKRCPEADSAEIDETVLTCLKHVHIFHPQSLASTTATLEALSGYLFDSQRHFSFDRAVGFVALDSASAFYWQDKAETEDAAFLSSTTTGMAGAKPAPTQSGYASLASTLKSVCKALQCPAIITSYHLGPTSSSHQHRQTSQPRSIRPSLPAPFANLPTVRLVVQRKAVRKFPLGISVTEALKEGPMRMKAVEEGGFECVFDEWDVSEVLVRRLREAGGGFAFRISAEGVSMEEESGGDG